MPKVKYKYNPQTLNYEPIQRSWLAMLLRFFLWLSPGVVIGMLITFAFFGTQKSVSDTRSIHQLDKRRLMDLETDFQLTLKALEEISQRDEDLYRVSLYAEKMPSELKVDRFFNTFSVDEFSEMSNQEMLQVLTKRLHRLERQIVAQGKSIQDLIQLAKEKDKLLQCIPAIQPIHQLELKQLASGFGYRIDPIYKTQRMHTGMDFTADIGTPVYATGNGKIDLIESEEWDYGKSIVINHGFGYKTRYAHLNGFAVRLGQDVKRGELIGYVGNTGKSTGPHLHYEVERNGEKVNPIHFYHGDLSPKEYQRLLDMSANSYRVYD